MENHPPTAESADHFAAVPTCGADMATKRWRPPTSRVMTAEEIGTVLIDCRARARSGGLRAFTQLVVFELASITGLRAGEIAGLKMRDVRLTQRPYLALPGTICKGKKSRDVDIIDAGMIADLRAWYDMRRQVMHASDDAPFICSTYGAKIGNKIDRGQVADRFKGAVKALGPDRASELYTHMGRHSAVTQMLARGFELAAVRDQVGHSNISVTDTYAHAMPASGEAREMYTKGPPLITVVHRAANRQVGSRGAAIMPKA